MKYIIYSIFIYILFFNKSYADDMIFYKYADGNAYSVFVAPSSDKSLSVSARDVIAKLIVNFTFMLDNISKDYYNINITKDIVYFGEDVTQYDIIPVSKDRFRHIIWIDSQNNPIKTEIFDNNNKLMIAFSNVDFHGKNKSYEDIKFDFKNEKPFYKGFYHIYSKVMRNGVNHLIFSDGINKFSLFIDYNTKDTGSISKIVYGNYLYSKVISGVEYTIVGSIPYEIMNEVIEVVSSNNSEVSKLIKAGSKISENIFTHTYNTEEIHK